MEEQVFETEVREVSGTSAVRRLRRGGKVPAVLYGHGETTLSLALADTDIRKIVGSGHHLVSLTVGGREEKAIIKDVQWNVWGGDVLHVDFSRVSLDELVSVNVEIKAHGTPKSILAGAVLDQPLHQVEVSCKADHIPDEIVVEIGDLEPGDMIRVSDLVLPEGVTVVVDAKVIVFALHEAREDVEAPEELAADAAAAEPELIGSSKETEAESPGS